VAYLPPKNIGRKYDEYHKSYIGTCKERNEKKTYPMKKIKLRIKVDIK
jgi:hypothetical protein